MHSVESKGVVRLESVPPRTGYMRSGTQIKAQFRTYPLLFVLPSSWTRTTLPRASWPRAERAEMTLANRGNVRPSCAITSREQRVGGGSGGLSDLDVEL